MRASAASPRRHPLAWLAVLWACALALNLDQVLGLIRFNPLFFQLLAVGGLGLAAIVVPAVRRTIRRGLDGQASLAVWGTIGVVIAVLWLPLAQDDETGRLGLRLAISTMLLLLSLAAAGAVSNAGTARFTGWLVLATLLAAILSVLLDPLLDFRRLLPTDDIDRSRAGGVFLQPNLAAMVIPLLLAAVLSHFGGVIGLLSLLLSAVAVTLTFSRAGLLLLALVTLLAVWHGRLPRVLALVSIGAVIGTMVLVLGGESLAQALGLSEGSGFSRLTRPIDFLSGRALRGDVRAELVESAWTDFTRRPVAGYGTGYSWAWPSYQPSFQGPHSMYLRYMLEYGALGALLWPWFALAIYRARATHSGRSWALGMAMCVLVAGWFSHNLSEQSAFLAAAVLSVALPPHGGKPHRVMPAGFRPPGRSA